MSWYVVLEVKKISFVCRVLQSEKFSDMNTHQLIYLKLTSYFL